jgi:hypothetical protein
MGSLSITFQKDYSFACYYLSSHIYVYMFMYMYTYNYSKTLNIMYSYSMFD